MLICLHKYTHKVQWHHFHKVARESAKSFICRTKLNSAEALVVFRLQGVSLKRERGRAIIHRSAFPLGPSSSAGSLLEFVHPVRVRERGRIGRPRRCPWPRFNANISTRLRSTTEASVIPSIHYWIILSLFPLQLFFISRVHLDLLSLLFEFRNIFWKHRPMRVCADDDVKLYRSIKRHGYCICVRGLLWQS